MVYPSMHLYILGYSNIFISWYIPAYTSPAQIYPSLYWYIMAYSSMQQTFSFAHVTGIRIENLMHTARLLRLLSHER